jgi:hypothetical protein
MGTNVIYHIGVGHERPGYDTIGAWESATQIDCVASGVVIIGQLSHNQSYDEDSLVMAGATTDGDNFRMLRPAPSSIGTGKRGTGPAIFSNLGGFTPVINIQENHFKMEDLEVHSDGIGTAHGVFVTGVSHVAVSGLVVYDCVEGGILYPGSSGTATNCIVHHVAANPAKTGAFQGTAADTTAFIARHCTALAETEHTSKDVTGYRYMVAQNCISANYGTSAGHACFLNMGAGTNNNASTDTSAGTVGASGVDSIDPRAIFLNIESGDATNLHIKSYPMTIRQKASGLPTDASGVPVDIDKETLRVEPWDHANSGNDIGADQWYPTPGGENVLEIDADLVFLYRYTAFDTVGDEVLDNESASAVYTGLNTSSVSGALEKVDGPGIQASGSSGVRASGGSLETFHLPHSPDQSGNASGIDGASDQDFSMGGWFMIGHDTSPSQAFYDFLGKYAVGSNMRSFKMGCNSGASGPEWAWRCDIGNTAGDAALSLRNVDLLVSGVWQHVVVTVDSDTTSNNVKMFVSGILRTSGSTTYAPGTSGAYPSFRQFATNSSTAEFNSNACGGRGAQLAEIFYIRRELTEAEVLGVFNSGIIEGTAVVAPNTGVFQSDLNDTLKDTIGPQSISASEIRLTAWDANNAANPSGVRHMTSGYHPAWIENISTGGSGLNFGRINQHTASGIKAITFRNITPETAINNIRFWMPDTTAFGAVTGWEVSEHVNSLWLPNLTLPSGSGVVGRVLGDATAILQSDGSATISGATLDGASISGESGISQYIYLSFVTNENFVPDTYGPTGFGFRLTMDNE